MHEGYRRGGEQARKRGGAEAAEKRRRGEAIERRRRGDGIFLVDGVANSMDERLLVVGVVGVWWQVGWPIWTTT